MGKVWYKSKTLWVAFIVFLAAILKVFFGFDIPVSDDAAWVGIAWSAIQTLLRFITKEPVSKSTS